MLLLFIDPLQIIECSNFGNWAILTSIEWNFVQTGCRTTPSISRPQLNFRAVQYRCIMCTSNGIYPYKSSKMIIPRHTRKTVTETCQDEETVSAHFWRRHSYVNRKWPVTIQQRRSLVFCWNSCKSSLEDHKIVFAQLWAILTPILSIQILVQNMLYTWDFHSTCDLKHLQCSFTHYYFMNFIYYFWTVDSIKHSESSVCLAFCGELSSLK